MFERHTAAQAALEKACAIANYPRGDRWELDTRVQGFQISHLPLDGEGASFSPNGAPVSKKLLGTITEPAFGDICMHMQPNAWFHFLSDHAVVFRVFPLGPGKSMVRTTWLVHPDAVEDVDYDLENLTAVWKATNDEDRVLVEGTQLGVADPGYIPGPYTRVEGDVNAFTNWYVGRLRAHLAE
jgi:Rieske 2Fe-2S family protein